MLYGTTVKNKRLVLNNGIHFITVAPMMLAASPANADVPENNNVVLFLMLVLILHLQQYGN